MAIDHFNSYPHFYANQVLKCSDLNDSFGFLDEQARLSRLHLVGQGIISGLEVSFQNNSVLKVGKGVALDNGGWVVQLTEDTEYRFVAEVPYSEVPFESDDLEKLVVSGGGRVTHICFKTKDDALELGLKPVSIATVRNNNYLVALAFGKRRDLRNRCSHDSCDINVTKMLVEAWPVLVKPASSPLFKRLLPLDKHLFPFEPCYLKVGNGDIKCLNGIIVPEFKKQQEELVTILKDILSYPFGQTYVPRKKKSPGFSAKASAWDHVFPDSRRLFARLHGCIQKTENYCPSAGTNHVWDYQLSFFNDLRQAISEFIEAYNEFAAENIFIPDWIPDSRLTFLGRPFKSDDGLLYKSHFRKADASASESGALRLGRMVRRICLLSEHFIGNPAPATLDKMNFNLVTIRPGARLSEKPIPFYYRNTINPEFLVNWNADRSSTYRAAPDYESTRAMTSRKNTRLLPQTGMHLYLEAYYGKSPETVKNKLLTCKSGWWLSPTIKFVDLPTFKRLSPSQKEFLDKYFAVNAFIDKYYGEVAQKVSGNALSLAVFLHSFWKSRKNEKGVADCLQTFRKGEGIGYRYPKITLEKINDAMDGLWDMTRAFKAAIGLDYKDKGNKFADPVYSAFLGLFHCILGMEDWGYDLCEAVLCGPILPKSTVVLLTRDNQVFSYVVLY